MNTDNQNLYSFEDISKVCQALGIPVSKEKFFENRELYAQIKDNYDKTIKDYLFSHTSDTFKLSKLYASEGNMPLPIAIGSARLHYKKEAMSLIENKKLPVPLPEGIEKLTKQESKPFARFMSFVTHPFSKPSNVQTQPVQEPVPQPVAQPVPEPTPQPVAQPAPEPTPQPVVQPAPEQMPRPVAQPATEQVKPSDVVLPKPKKTIMSRLRCRLPKFSLSKASMINWLNTLRKKHSVSTVRFRRKVANISIPAPAFPSLTVKVNQAISYAGQLVRRAIPHVALATVLTGGAYFIYEEYNRLNKNAEEVLASADLDKNKEKNVTPTDTLNIHDQTASLGDPTIDISRDLKDKAQNSITAAAKNLVPEVHPTAPSNEELKQHDDNKNKANSHDKKKKKVKSKKTKVSKTELRKQQNSFMKRLCNKFYSSLFVNPFVSDDCILSCIPIGFENQLLTSSFDPDRKHPVTGKISPHDGDDYSLIYTKDDKERKDPLKKPINEVKSSAGGVVVFSGWKKGYGNYIVVQHDNEYATAYAHLSKRNVKVGDTVEKGDVIGKPGGTGIGTGKHLHFEVLKRYGNEWLRLDLREIREQQVVLHPDELDIEGIRRLHKKNIYWNVNKLASVYKTDDMTKYEEMRQAEDIQLAEADTINAEDNANEPLVLNNNNTITTNDSIFTRGSYIYNNGSSGSQTSSVKAESEAGNTETSNFHEIDASFYTDPEENTQELETDSTKVAYNSYQTKVKAKFPEKNPADTARLVQHILASKSQIH